MLKSNKSANKKHAYLIIAHNNFYTLKKLIELLDDDRNDIYIHIDSKVKSYDFSLLKSVVKKSNIEIYSNIAVYWGDYSQVEVELFLLKKATLKSYCYYHLLSGVDLPLKSQTEIHNFFYKNRGKEFVHFTSSEISKDKINWISHYHFLQKFVRCSKFNAINKLFAIFEKILLTGQKILGIKRYDHTYQLQKGANWFSITDDFAKYVLSQEKWIEKHFKFSKSADEIFMQTILINSKFRSHLYLDSFNDDYHACMRYIDWNRGNPYTFHMKDFNELLCSDFLWARKFDENIDKKIIDEIYNTIKKENEK